MPQIPRNLRLAYQRYFSDNAVTRWISKKQAIIMKEPQTRAVLCWILHYAVFVNTLLILCLFRINPIKFVRLSAYAFYVSGSFVFLCAVVEYLERRKEIHSLRDLKTICAAVWLHYEVYRVLIHPFLFIPPFRHCLERFGYRYNAVRAEILDLLVTPKDLWLMDSHGWARDMLVLDQGAGRTIVFSLPDMQSLGRSFIRLVESNDRHWAKNTELRDLGLRIVSLFRERVRALEKRHAMMDQKFTALVNQVIWCQEQILHKDEEDVTFREQVLSISRIYHLLVWRRLVDLKARLSRTTEDAAATQGRLALLLEAHEALEADYDIALEEKQELLLELADQDDQLRKAQGEVTEWQTIAEGVCYSHSTMANQVKATKKNMYNAVYSLLSCLFFVWRFAMALKAESVARAHLDREEIAALRRRLVLVENAKDVVVVDRAMWRSMYEETEKALDEVINVYTQQRATHLAQTRQLLTGLLLLWWYCRILAKKLYEARLRMHMCPISCKGTGSGVPAPLSSADCMDRTGDLTTPQALILRLSRSNVAYASLLVQHEQLQDELDDAYGSLEYEQAERKTEREKLEAELAGASTAIENLRTEFMMESDKLRSELEEARTTIEALRTAKEAAELELQNKRNEMALARATVQQMRTEVEETKRNLESRVMEWCELASGTGRPMLLEEPHDNDDLRNLDDDPSPSLLSPSEDGDVVLLSRDQSPPMLMERRERELHVDPSELVRCFPAPPPPPIERKSSSEGRSSAPRMSTPAIADPQLPPIAHPAPQSHAMTPVIDVGAFDFPNKPVPFHPSIGLYSGSSRLAQPQPVSTARPMDSFSQARSPSPVIPNTPPSSEGSPVVSDRSSSPEANFYTPALPAVEF